MIDCNQEDKCRVCGGDGSACETTSNVIKDQDMTMGYNDLAMIPPGATNIRIAEVQFFSSSIKWIGHSLQPCDFRWRLPTTTWPWGTRPATITWTATGGSTTHSSSRQRVSCSLWQHSIHPSIFSIPGTTFHYERKYKNSKARGPLTLFAPESIRALGPTTEALFIVVSIVIIGIEISRDLEFTTINF